MCCCYSSVCTCIIARRRGRFSPCQPQSGVNASLKYVYECGSSIVLQFMLDWNICTSHVCISMEKEMKQSVRRPRFLKQCITHQYRNFLITIISPSFLLSLSLSLFSQKSIQIFFLRSLSTNNYFLSFPLNVIFPKFFLFHINNIV